MILLIDNYDSFSYNVYQLVGSVNPDIRVIRNDECSVDEIRAMNPSHIILSPGPGRPDKAGVCENVIRELGGRIPILGICLGHQAICHQRMISCHSDHFFHTPEQYTVCIQSRQGLFTVHQMGCVGNGSPCHFADRLMPETDSQNRYSAPQFPDHIFTDTGFVRPSGSRR